MIDPSHEGVVVHHGLGFHEGLSAATLLPDLHLLHAVSVLGRDAPDGAVVLPGQDKHIPVITGEHVAFTEGMSPRSSVTDFRGLPSVFPQSATGVGVVLSEQQRGEPDTVN